MAQAEEALWTELIDKYRGLDAPWSADVVGRALGNRGNSRARQGRLEAALQDFDAAIALCPWAVDPVLNRGVALEGLERWNDAIRCAGRCHMCRLVVHTARAPAPQTAA